MKRIKILFIITYLELGGAQKQLLSILQSLDKKRYDIHLFAGSCGYLLDKFKNLQGVTLKLSSHLRREISLSCDLASFLEIYHYVKVNGFDIVHLHSPKASFLGRWAAYLAGAKNIIYTVHGWPFHAFMNPFLFSLYWIIEFSSARITKKIIVVSKADLKTGITKFIAGEKKLELIYYGIDIDKFHSISCHRRNSFIDNKTIMVVSSFKKQKGLNDFLVVVSLLLRQLPDTKFILIGKGPLFSAVKDKLKKESLEGSVEMVGWQENIDIYYEKASLLLLTSLWEGLPVCLIEAVVAGLPVVCTDTGGVKDLIKNADNGIIVQVKDILGLKNACLDMLENYSDWYKKIVKYRFDIDVSIWSDDRMLRQLQEIYSDIVE